MNKIISTKGLNEKEAEKKIAEAIDKGLNDFNANFCVMDYHDNCEIELDFIKEHKSKNSQNPKNLLFIFECITELEPKIGMLIPIEYLIEEASKNNIYKIKLSKKDIIQIVDNLMILGFIFMPRKGFIVKIKSWDKHFKNKAGKK